MSEFRYTRPNNFPPIVKNLIIINVLVWLVQMMFDQEYNISARLGLWPVESPLFSPYQIATHMFAHAAGGSMAFYHILFNMFNLWMFGKILENVWGAKRFLFFYLICGIGAAITHMAVQYFEYKEIFEQVIQLGATEEQAAAAATREIGYVIGASGAVMGVMVAFAFLFPNTELMFMFLPVPIKAKWLITGLIALDLYFGFNRAAGDSVAHFAHLGGALTGFIIVFIWNKTNRRTFY